MGLFELTKHGILFSIDRVVRREPLRPHAQANDIYIASTRNLGALHKRVKEILFGTATPTNPLGAMASVTLHALGPACISTAVRLAVEVSEKYAPWIRTSVSTSTETVYDDYEPIVPGVEPFTHERYVSAIHIGIHKISSTTVETDQKE